MLVAAQALGYTVSKFVGIRVIAETPPQRRSRGILLLIALAEVMLVLLGVAPSPLDAACLFMNGLALGMAFRRSSWKSSRARSAGATSTP